MVDLLKKGLELTDGEKLISRAIKKFGTTTTPEKAAFLFPDGQLLDFSTGLSAREIPHDVIRQIKLPNTRLTVRDFLNKTGAIRVDLSTIDKGAFNFELGDVKPTQRQTNIMKRFSVKGLVFIDIPKSAKNMLSKAESFTGIGAQSKIIGFLNKAFKGSSKLLSSLPLAPILKGLGIFGNLTQPVDIASKVAGRIAGGGPLVPTGGLERIAPQKNRLSQMLQQLQGIKGGGL